MDSRIEIRSEGRRGCGYRKQRALYMVNFEDEMRPCPKMPVPLSTCPICGQGIKPARQWIWVDADELLDKQRLATVCPLCKDENGCPMVADATIGRAGLLWVGERHYATPEDFMAEAQAMGISRRVQFVPYGFEIGKTFVLLGHLHAIPSAESGKPGTPGIFFIYRPRAVEYVCSGKETKEEVDALIKRGITPVKVINSEDSI